MDMQDFWDDFDVTNVAKALLYFGFTKTNKFMSSNNFKPSIFDARKAVSEKLHEIESLNLTDPAKKLLMKDFEELKRTLYQYVFACNVNKIENSQVARFVLTEAEVLGNIFLIWNTLLKENPDWLLSIYTAFSLMIVDLLRQQEQKKIIKNTKAATIIKNNISKNYSQGR